MLCSAILKLFCSPRSLSTAQGISGFTGRFRTLIHKPYISLGRPQVLLDRSVLPLGRMELLPNCEGAALGADGDDDTAAAGPEFVRLDAAALENLEVRLELSVSEVMRVDFSNPRDRIALYSQHLRSW